MPPTIWIDVEDLFLYAAFTARPSGIQRLSFEIEQALVARCGIGGMVRFLRYDHRHAAFAEVAWKEVLAVYAGMAAAPHGAARVRTVPARAAASGWLRGRARTLADRLPGRVRAPLGRAVRLQVQALRALAQAIRAVLVHLRTKPIGTVPEDGASRFAADVRAGDVLLTLGAGWEQRDFADALARTRARHGMCWALLVYDLIPVRCPEWSHDYLTARFGQWLDRMLPLADRLMTISHASAHDLEAYAAERGIALAGPVHTIPIGTGFSHQPAPAPAPAGSALPQPGTYVLFVSTMEVRKNHALLFRVWRRLLDEMPQDAVPTLVFAGRIGWLMNDLLQQLENTSFLYGRVVIIEDPSDADLVALYRGCLFTLFPSLYEGWGLPVTESLAFGKPCVIANATSLPEAGGSLARYFDPDNLSDAVRVIRAVLEDRAALTVWEEQIRREFRPIPWSASAEAVLAALTEARPRASA